VGLYHYADPSVGSAHEQADVFASVLERYDAIKGTCRRRWISSRDGHLGGWLRAFPGQVAFGDAARRVMVYSSVSFSPTNR